MIVIQPSMRSLFDQRLRIGFIPVMSTTNATTVKIVIPQKRGVLFGRTLGSRNARTTHTAKAASTRHRNVRALPVMYGKNIEFATMSGTKSDRPKRTYIMYRKTLLLVLVFMVEIVYHN